MESSPCAVDTPCESVATARREDETRQVNAAAAPASAEEDCLEAPDWADATQQTHRNPDRSGP